MYLENAQPVYNYVRYLDIAKLIKQAGKCSDRELKLYYKSRYVLENTKGCVNENAASVQNSNVYSIRDARFSLTYPVLIKLTQRSVSVKLRIAS